MSTEKFPRRDFMTPAQRRAISGILPRRHDLCKQLLKAADLAEVGRPGKTAQDRARRGGAA